MTKEACVETLEEAKQAEQLGAHRIELCSRLDLDGITPNKELIEKTMNSLSIPVKVMIRPRGGNFIYSAEELKEMEESIQFCKKMNVKGVVFGILDDKNRLNLEQINMLAELASPLEVTIHKAIDQSPDMLTEVTELVKMESITSILSSGGATTAFEGKELLKKMILLSGSSIKIIPAGSITNQNLSEIHEKIGADEYHGRRIVGNL
jgi:copper homeostasis protein